jgi:small-conductance mechanosensitive channel
VNERRAIGDLRIITLAFAAAFAVLSLWGVIRVHTLAAVVSAGSAAFLIAWDRFLAYIQRRF